MVRFVRAVYTWGPHSAARRGHRLTRMTRTYGNHTLTDELYRTPFGFVGTARPVGAGPGNGPRLIKVFSPTVGDEAARNVEADAFVERAAAQQKLASRDRSHWGRIY